jgi:hypothetical protein
MLEHGWMPCECRGIVRGLVDEFEQHKLDNREKILPWAGETFT